MKRFVLLFFALAGFISSAAGQEQEITGFAYVSETPTPRSFRIGMVMRSGDRRTRIRDYYGNERLV